MKTYKNYQEIKNEHKNKAYEVFTKYVMDVINLEERKKIRDNWNQYNSSLSWQDYLIRDVNVIKKFNKNRQFRCL